MSIKRPERDHSQAEDKIGRAEQDHRGTEAKAGAGGNNEIRRGNGECGQGDLDSLRSTDEENLDPTDETGRLQVVL